MLEFRKITTAGIETIFDLMASGYSFRVKSAPLDPEINYEKRAFSHGAIQTGDRSFNERDVILEGYIVDSDSTDDADLLWAALTAFFRPVFFPTTTDEIRLYISECLYYKVDSIQRIQSSYIKGTERRAASLTIEVGCADPFQYEYEPAYVGRFDSSSKYILEGRGAVEPESGFIASWRQVGIDGDGYGGVAVESTTTNLLTANQASVETDTTGFNAVLGAALAKSSTYSIHLKNSLRITPPGAAPNEGFYTTGVAGSNGEIYKASVYIITGGVAYNIYLYDADNAAAGATVTATPSTIWQRIEVSITLGADTTDLRLYVVTQGQTSFVFYCDALQIEHKAWHTSFACLTRAAGQLFYDCLTASYQAEELTVSFRFKPDVAWDDAATKAGEIEYLISQYDGADIFSVYVNRATTRIYLAIQNGLGGTDTRSYNYSADANFTGKTANRIGIVLVEGIVLEPYFYINGVLKNSGGTPASTTWSNNTLELGNTANTAGRLPEGIFDELVICPEDKRSEIASWHSSFSTYFPRRGWLAYYRESRDAASTADSFSINNPGSWNSHPIIGLHAQGTCSDVTVTNTTDDSLLFDYDDSGLTVGLETVIDCRYGTLLRGVTNTAAYFQGAFLKLLPGDNTITYKGANCDVKLKYQTKRA